ncbi:MAG: M48 family metalloprotease [Erythrobacter sp.]|uniref:M48 family metalloprotease n=1 Tax=Erythrobacter sp. TaxID=1042 RepID=UPI00261CCEE2|nr:M48 family metalloprotease [Erythrobacter sp.]MDJ0977372.1 M48 family metalloprotease [Erythrobacter sp.]
MRLKRRTFLVGAATPLALGLSGCLGAGAPIPSASTPITPAEAQQGADYHPQLLAQFGGEMRGPLANYVERIGLDMAAQSQLGGARQSFNVSLLNSSVSNAFAVPGGYIYTTRQLVALMNNEAELAAVLGHEVGHVVARHSARRQRSAQRNQVLGGLGAVLSTVLLGDSQVGDLLARGAMQAPQFITLAYSREQEEEADRLGIDYLSRGNYDPNAMASLLQRLARQVELDARIQGREDARPPVWASTHPDPVDRVRLATRYATGKPGRIQNRDAFLAAIDGMIYGDDPEQGIIKGYRFIHPNLGFSFSAPQGFYMLNSSRAVSINPNGNGGQTGQAQLTAARYSGDLEAYVREQFRAFDSQNNALAPQEFSRTRVNGLNAAYGSARVRSGNSQVDLVIFAYEFGRDRAFHFAALAPAGRIGPFNPMFQSMRRISDQEASAVVPLRIDVVTVQRGDTVSGLARRMAFSDNQEARFRVLNGLGSGNTLRAGQKVKLIVRRR